MLFDARVRAIDPRFSVDAGNLEATIAVCHAVDGLPLALEMVAARCASLGLPAVQQHLDARLRWPNGHAPFAPDRQQTLFAVMDWSHSLLSPVQQLAFRRLGVFAGGFSLAMVHGVLSDQNDDEAFHIDLLAELLEHSLVSLDLAQPTPLISLRMMPALLRYRTLHTICETFCFFLVLDRGCLDTTRQIRYPVPPRLHPIQATLREAGAVPSVNTARVNLVTEA